MVKWSSANGTSKRVVLALLFSCCAVPILVTPVMAQTWIQLGTDPADAYTYETSVEYTGGTTSNWNLITFPGIWGDAGQSFTTTNAISVEQVELYLKKHNNPSDIYLEIRSGTITGEGSTVLGTSNIIDSSTLSKNLSWETFEFSTPISLNANTQYYLRIRSTGTTGYVAWGYNHDWPSGYSGGIAYRNIGYSNPEYFQPLDQYDFSFRICSATHLKSVDKIDLYFYNDGTFAYFKETLLDAPDISAYTYTIYIDKPAKGNTKPDFRIVYSSGTSKLEKSHGSNWVYVEDVTVTTASSPYSICFNVSLSGIANPDIQQDTKIWFVEYEGANSFTTEVDRAPNTESYYIGSESIPELPWPMPLLFIPAVAGTIYY
ncbi:MAG: hypothetical protein NWF02_08290, partial [Candidatus Bathyarchaeota archaeon]|nr:hypothetical protein [Candidatus Bathyarchaeum sp.]